MKIGEIYILTYRAGGTHVASATSKDLIHWEKKGILFPTRSSTNSGAILPERINGKFIMYHGDSNIWIAYSEDLLHWESSPEPVMRPRGGYFDDELVEPGPPPLVTRDGILLLYHGKIEPHRRTPWAKFCSQKKILRVSCIEVTNPSLNPPKIGRSTAKNIMLYSLQVW